MILVGNKADIKSKQTVQQNDINKYIAKLGIKYFEVSALNNEGIDELFNYAIQETIKLIVKRENDLSATNRISHLNEDENEVKEKKGFKCC